MSRTAASPRSPAVLAALLLMAVLLGAASAFFADSRIDDAFIFYRYADHVRAGHGPVFNPGERVEGFTSPLWLLLLVLGGALGISYDAAAVGIGGVAALAALPSVWLVARRAAPPVPALLAPLLLALHPGFAMWAVHGLETPLFVALLAAAWAAWAGGHPGAAGLLLGLATWTRPEALLVAGVLAVAGLLCGRRRDAAWMLAGVATLALLLQGLRLAYYGAWAPNTFFAKTGGGWQRLRFGLGEARRFVGAHAPLVVAVLAASGAALARAAGPHRRTRLPAVVLEAIALGALWSAWVIWVGGDGFFGFRFWLPVLPAAGVVLAWGCGRLLQARGAPALPLALGAVLLVAATAAGAWPEARREQLSGRQFTEKMTLAGRWLREHVPGDAVIAVNYVGALPYHAGLRSIDMLGLTDTVVARTPIRGRFRWPGHARGNGAAILDRRPEMILMNGVHLAPEPLAGLAPELASEEQIAADPRFARDYEPVNVRLQGPDGPLWFGFYKRKDWEWTPSPG